MNNITLTRETIESIGVADVFEVEEPLKYNGCPPDHPFAEYRPLSAWKGAKKFYLCSEEGPLLFPSKFEAGLFLAGHGVTLDKVLALDFDG